MAGRDQVILPGVGHYLPAAVYPQIADEGRALADRAATAAPKPGQDLPQRPACSPPSRSETVARDSRWVMRT
jgi:hypothetical protein